MKTLPAIPSQDVVKEIFTEVLEKKDKIISLLSKVKVGDDATLAKAEDRVRDANDLIKNIKKIEDVTKKPYYESYKHIMSYSKLLQEQITSASQIARSNIQSYKTIEAAKKRAQIQKAEEEAQKNLEKKQQKINLLNLIVNQMLARIYGGKFETSSGREEVVPPCYNVSDVLRIRNSFKNSFPEQEKFSDIMKSYAETHSLINDELIWAKETIEKMNSDDELVANKATNDFDARKNYIRSKFLKMAEKSEKRVEKEVMKETRTIQNEAKEYSKGIRNVLVFKVTDFSNVSDAFKEINESELRQYMSKHSDRIKELVKEGKGDGVLNGIEFEFRQDLSVR